MVDVELAELGGAEGLPEAAAPTSAVPIHDSPTAPHKDPFLAVFGTDSIPKSRPALRPSFPLNATGCPTVLPDTIPGEFPIELPMVPKALPSELPTVFPWEGTLPGALPGAALEPMSGVVVLLDPLDEDLSQGELTLCQFSAEEDKEIINFKKQRNVAKQKIILKKLLGG